MYFDPGFGGMLFQVIVAIIAAGGALMFSFRRRIRAWFKKDNTPQPRANAINSNTNIDASSDDMVDALADDTTK